ncbi:hypothetical protein B0T17DRAFT_508667 [Bombardia bombarda]|uniref:Serine-rich protein n=1 Tax=Bombardia bombarda TaxID=252184 RepID=A0AA39WTG4_9PEZI|nr:hypothetical protein B0T17DRAFT_508667 [Bombardia bombarda]
MSAPSNRHGRTTTPLHSRSQSQNIPLAIRIVPYSPPRLDPEGRTPSQTSSRTHAGRSLSVSGDYGDQASGSVGENRRPNWRGEVPEDYASSPGSALSSSSFSSLLLAKAMDEGVSASKPTGSSPSTPILRGPTTQTLTSPSEVSINIATINAAASQASDSPTSTAGGGPGRPLSRRRNYVTIHADKTFSLVRPGEPSDVSSSLKSPPLSYSSRTSSSQERPSIDAWSDYRSSSQLTGGTNATIPDHSFPELVPYTPSPGSSTTQLVEDPITSSPWNYRMVGGLRKVPKTPDLKQKTPLYNTTSTGPDIPLAPLPEVTVQSDEEEETFSRTLVPKTSFTSTVSAQTISTASETSNYKVYGPGSVHESVDSLALPSTSHSNYEVYVLGQSSPPAPSSSSNQSNYVVLGQSSPDARFSSSPPDSSDSNENFVVHGDPTPSPSPSPLAALPRQPRPTYSRESLVVPPLRPAKKRSSESFGYYKQRSRENLRVRAGSLQSLKSISSVISNHDASQAFIAAPVLINFGATVTRDTQSGSSGSTTHQLFPWSATQGPESSTDSQHLTVQRLPTQMIPSHPHQWSSQLSTVASESESDRDPSRSTSPSVIPTGHRRRNSNGWGGSMHSRQLQSISSSLVQQLDDSTSASDSLDRPQPTYARAVMSLPRMIRDQDEHGDGLTDLEDQPRSGLSAFFSSSNSSNRNLHSSSSSRANSISSRANSINGSTIPTWAKVYYGSGERRFLGAPSIIISEAGDSRPPSSTFQSDGSPNSNQYPMSLHNQRKRAREVFSGSNQRPQSDSGSLNITSAPMGHDYNAFRAIKRKTSSIWSPHLRMDRRASRYSVWDPPSVSWSADTGVLGKRNLQVVLFILGFVFPFAWMIAAFLPLPPNPNRDMIERGDHSEDQFGRFQRQPFPQPRVIDETRYASVRWWRNLNRVMSVVGLLIVGAIIALAVVGVRQGWAVHNS